MKKLISLVLVLCAVASMAACSPKAAADPMADKPLTEVMQTILTDVEQPMGVEMMELDSEMFPMFTFIDYIEGAEAVISEGMITAIAHSVVLVRVPEGTDAAEVAAQIDANADTRKWICVEAEKKIVSQHGSLVLLVMSNEAAATAIAENFDNLYN